MRSRLITCKQHFNSFQDYLTIGIPTIARKTGSNYLIATLNSLISDEFHKSSQSEILTVILLGDSNENNRKKLAVKISNLYSSFIASGVIDVIQVPFGYYPSRAKLKRRFGDSEFRIKWRSKQVVDFSFLLCYCYGLGKYHLQLEDDVLASPQYFLKLKDFIEDYEKKETWFTLDASVLGYIGKVYHNNDLNEIATFYYLFFDEMPVDWLEYNWREIKGQSGRWRFRAASLFQHCGKVSSMAGKENPLKEPYFDNHSHKFLGRNPPAKLQTDLTGQQNLAIESAYEKGSGFFWATCRDRLSCFIKIIFQDTVTVKRIVIESGANFALNDTIHKGSLESGTAMNGDDCLHYDSRNPINIKGRSLDTSFPEGLTVNCLKLNIEKQKEWICLREINIWKK